jgi:hypothetical protein
MNKENGAVNVNACSKTGNRAPGRDGPYFYQETLIEI